MANIKDKVVVLRISEQLKTKLKKLADRMNITNSDLIRQLIQDEYKKRID